MSYAEEVAKARRLGILLALYFSAGYTMNREQLRVQISNTGYVTGHDLMKAELAWLNEMQLVDLLEFDAVMLTSRGEDVALARSEVPGVRRPSASEIKGKH